MTVTVARHAGYCFGVRDAVTIALDAATQYDGVYMLGDVVHNEEVVRKLDDVGAQVVKNLDDVQDRPILFRAHGTPVEIWEEAKRRNLRIIDATCPLVTQIHHEVEELESEGRQIIIIGDHGHDEVVGIASHVKAPIVVSKPDEVDGLRKMRKVGVVSQSTQTIENVQAILARLLMKGLDIRFINTICFPTKQNQSEVKDLAVANEVVIIVGSFTSANTKRLAQIAQSLNPRSYQVASHTDLRREWFDGVETVGVTAGASTPDHLIEGVVAALQGMEER
ncbi:MAG: 4-hydroxy-3-methylbut-2-enyl diphosphate reductase [Candidatus Latescibacteria bacterium]|nr:4-hydroxy-3-methylbut-2-enyl diphosphate reductase [Candidatus Latescibacterota bacterium]